MYIVNPEKLNQDKLFYCRDSKLKDYLISNEIMYISKKYHNSDNKITWIFAKTNELMQLIEDYSC